VLVAAGKITMAALAVGPGEVQQAEDGPAPKARATLGAIMAKAAPAAAPATVGGSGQAPGGDGWKAYIHLMEQLELRIRDLEAALFETMAMKMDHALIVGGKMQIKWYTTTVKLQPDLGSPHVYVAAGGLRHFLSNVSTTDPALLARLHALRILVFYMEKLPPADTYCFIRHFRLADMFQKEDQPARAKVIFKFEGTMTIPNPAENDAVFQIMTGTDEAQKMKLVEASFVMAEGEPVAVGKAVSIQKLVRSVLAQSGAEVLAGRAPMGAALRAVKGKGKGKNK